VPPGGRFTMRNAAVQPGLVPILSPGKHRTARQGACFMEFASYLAGERWSDHPECTHPTLGHLARMVNDCTSPAARERLAPMVPSVIGLTATDPLLDPLLALRAAHVALPVAAEERQRTIAVAVHMCIDDLRQPPGGADASRVDGLVAYANAILRSAPSADAWALRFIGQVRPARRRPSREEQCQLLITSAVDGLGKACTDDVDSKLVELLRQAITDTELAVHAEAAQRTETVQRTDGAEVVAGTPETTSGAVRV
jgi:hypothetical protein